MKTISISFLFSLLLIQILQFNQLKASPSSLKLVIEILRHGARTPKEFPFQPNFYNQNPGELTPSGARQQYLIGHELRNRYIINEPLLSPTYNQNELLVKSGEDIRCVNSATSQLTGMYPDHTGQTLDNDAELLKRSVPPFKVADEQRATNDLGLNALLNGQPYFEQTIIPRVNDLFYHGASKSVCSLVKDIIKKELAEKDIQDFIAFLQKTFYKRFAETVNKYSSIKVKVEDLDLSLINDIYDGYVTNRFHGKLPQIFSDTDEQLLKDIAILFRYKIKFGTEKLKKLGVTLMFQDISQLLLDKAYNPSGNSPRFVLYSAHDHNLVAVLSNLLLDGEIILFSPIKN
jgi:hypothetical protein